MHESCDEDLLCECAYDCFHNVLGVEAEILNFLEVCDFNAVDPFAHHESRRRELRICPRDVYVLPPDDLEGLPRCVGIFLLDVEVDFLGKILLD